VFREKEGKAVLITLQNDQLTVTIDSLGAQMQTLVAADTTDYLWGGDKAYWASRATMIFPFVGRLHEGRYTLDGASYPLGSHGFLRHSETRVVRHSPAEALFELTDSPETLRQYPRRFLLEIHYQLSGAALTTTMTVHNWDDRVMPFALGGHPGFRVPLENGLAFEDYALDFSGPAQCHLMSDRALATGEVVDYPLQDGLLPLHHGLFDRDAIILTTASRRVRLFSNKGQRSVTLSHPGLPYLGIWHTPNSDAPFVCLEPWLAMPGRDGVVEDLMTAPGLVRLAPGASYENGWTIAVS